MLPAFFAVALSTYSMWVMPGPHHLPPHRAPHDYRVCFNIMKVKRLSTGEITQLPEMGHSVQCLPRHPPGTPPPPPAPLIWKG